MRTIILGIFLIFTNSLFGQKDFFDIFSSQIVNYKKISVGDMLTGVDLILYIGNCSLTDKVSKIETTAEEKTIMDDGRISYLMKNYSNAHLFCIVRDPYDFSLYEQTIDDIILFYECDENTFKRLRKRLKEEWGLPTNLGKKTFWESTSTILSIRYYPDKQITEVGLHSNK